MTREEIHLKSINSALAVLLTAGLLLIQTGCTETTNEPTAENPALSAPVPAGTIRGTVLETMDSGGYTYVLVETSEIQVWAAGPQTTAAVGDVVEISQGMPMNQFESKTLNRTFDVLYFVNAITNLTTPAPTQSSVSEPVVEDVADVADVNVAELESGQNIAYVYANKDSLADQSISLRGKVVKYNSNILGWNFIHVQDGSGDAADGNNDLTVTSKAMTAVGETVVLTGAITLDKDFGAGYRFPVLMEDASIATE